VNRKGRMEVKGRFTIIDWSPDSPAASPFHHELNVGSSKIDSPRKRMLRKQLSSGSKHGSPAGPTASQQTMSAVNYARERRMLSLNAPSTANAPPTPRANLHMFDNHLAFLEKESKDMKSTLESMVNTNAQWIEMLAKSGLNLAPECTPFQASEPSVVEPTVVAPVATAAPSNLAASIRRPSFDAKYHTLEMAYVSAGLLRRCVDTVEPSELTFVICGLSCNRRWSCRRSMKTLCGTMSGWRSRTSCSSRASSSR
jgi:hypothetical protein